MANFGVDGYTKAPNQRKLLGKTQKDYTIQKNY